MMVKPFEDAAFTVPVGQISDIIETQYGFHILKVESRTKETEPFETVKTQLTETLNGSKKAEAYRKIHDRPQEQGQVRRNQVLIPLPEGRAGIEGKRRRPERRGPVPVTG